MKKLLKGIFKRKTMKRSLIHAFIIVVFIPVMLVGTILVLAMRGILVRQGVTEAINNVHRIESSFSEVFRVFIDVSNRICSDKELESIVLKEYQFPWEVGVVYRNYTAFSDYDNYYSSLRSMRLYTTNEAFLDNRLQFLRVDEDVKNCNWYKNALIRNGQISWDYVYNEIKGEYYFCLTRLIKNTYGTNLGVLVMEADKEYLSSLLKDENYQVMVISDQGYVIGSNSVSYAEKKIENDELGKIVEKVNNSEVDINYYGHRAKAIIKTFYIPKSENHYKVVSIYPVSLIVKEATRVSLVAVAVIGASLFLAVILIIIFSDVLSERIDRLSVEIHAVAMGNLDTDISVDGDDEIAQLSQDFKTMVNSLNELIFEVYEVKVQKSQMEIREREIEFKMLANQINPHFLFNALEAIRMRAHKRGEPEISEKIKLLARLLRTSLEVGRDLITITKELELVQSYLEIQSFRFGDRFKYEIAISDEVRDYKLLPFTLQPIVENSVVHGIETIEEGGKIEVSIGKEGGVLKLIVCDNGGGMSEDRLREVKAMISSTSEESGQHIGLRNIHQRIQIHYGKQYGLNIDSEAGLGTKVSIFLPEEGEC